MAVFTVDTAADIASQNGAVNWWDALLGGNLNTTPSSSGTPTPPSGGLQGLFGANAPTGPATPTGTVSPLSDLFKDIPTGLANNDVTHTPNNNITVGGSPYMLRTGQTFAPKPGYSIIHGLHQGAYGYYEIPTADIANSAQKYGIFNLGQGPLTTSQMAQMNDPSGYQAGKYSAANNWGFNQTGGWVGTNPGTGGTNSGGTGGTGTGTNGGASTTTTNPPPSTPTPPAAPPLPELTGSRQSYLAAIDNYIKSQRPYATIDDALRRSFNLPGLAELQMNQQANPQANANNFVGNTAGMPFIPGSAPPQGFKWMWNDPDGSGSNPGNFGLVPTESFFNDLPGSNIQDLQSLVDTYNSSTYANKYLPTNLSSVLGPWGNFINTAAQGATGQRATLAPMESINLLAPMLENPDVSNYLGQLLSSVSGRMGSQYNNFDPFKNLNDPTKLGNFFQRANEQLGLLNLPSIDSVLGSYRGGATLGRDQFYNAPLDFYQPTEAAPAFFQYLLQDLDGGGANPATYGLRMRGAPNTQYDANQVLQTLNDPHFRGMFSASSNINPNIFTQTLNAEGNPIFRILDAYKFPGGAGGPMGTTSTPTQQIGTGAPGGPQLSMERWTPGAGEQSGAAEAAQRQAADSRWQSLYGGGFGTGDLNNQSPPPSGGTTPPGTTPPPATTTGDKPNPFSGVTPPATSGYQRPPKFWSPWAGF